ncbi:unnamed protein product [Linum trigynum]|uniref:RNase H type-1 domain-containing protein n=1 Tax=Linum trigynum TaxID=586398 RepID=A0AAV2GAF3_9ROSI
MAAGLPHQGVAKPYLAELLAVRDAITIVASSFLTHVILEGDSKWSPSRFNKVFSKVPLEVRCTGSVASS